ncbi:NUDIX hydrolase [Actinoplanes sp. SE50]|uniref:NUDIX hydrolase n=1 Tax=unclassified Actinoplanes TaxID=2626549 RepID=UPI00023EC7D0|nr:MULTISPECIES: NUDIX domain-containing protein [unclassified Actinoplanes]AEV84720.1 MutT/NUDIX family protein [Actinoplanes sp. SE50/110]ATO83112.1 NUDIX hydrolase [Actinoplanes sp. SE50]SLM00519.1 NUDIX hydrolase [Actinoplanes sp. SE50/110]
MLRPQKVVAYVVREGRLLVFLHVDDVSFDQSGLQVPAGTVRAGELPEAAVVREAAEETGLPGLRVERYLGVSEFDMRPYADAVHVRHFFHLTVDAPEVPERWFTEERGDGDGTPVRFECYWLPLAQGHVLAAGQSALLGRLFDGVSGGAVGSGLQGDGDTGDRKRSVAG